jgi:hypothetical protein
MLPEVLCRGSTYSELGLSVLESTSYVRFSIPEQEFDARSEASPDLSEQGCTHRLGLLAYSSVLPPAHDPLLLPLARNA